MSRETVVVSIGGSFLVGKDGVDVDLAREVADLLQRVTADGRRVIVVVGGGQTARRYITAARTLGADESALDEMGIAITRINARVLLAALSGAAPYPAESIEAAVTASATYPVVVMGGTHPGHTTDAVACIVGERARATRVVIATNVDAVYSKDPNKHADAERFTTVTSGRLVDITIRSESKAGGSGVVDSLGAKILHRSEIAGAVVHGRDLKALEAALTGATEFTGTRIVPGEA